MWSRIRWKGLDLPLYAKDTPGDGSCLIHSILFSISEVYRSMNKKGRSKLTRRIRNDIADDIVNHWDKVLDENDFEAIMLLDKDNIIREQYSKKNIIKELRCSAFLNDNIIKYLSFKFDINIIIYFELKKQLYFTGNDETDYDKKGTIIISFSGEAFEDIQGIIKTTGTGNHYETIGEKIDSHIYKVMFSNKDPVVKKIFEVSSKMIKELS